MSDITNNTTILKIHNEDTLHERYFIVMSFVPMKMTELLDSLFSDVYNEFLHLTPVSKTKALALSENYGIVDLSCEKDNKSFINKSEIGIMLEALSESY